ncbi:MAG: hypothetical protein R2722_13455 [Tessaracoccus sp.]
MIDTDTIHSIIRDTNIASMNVALRNGTTVRRHFVEHYRGVDMPHFDFVINRHTWETLREPGKPAT